MLASLRSRLALSNLLITLLGLAVMVFVTSRLLQTQSTQIKERDRADQSRALAAQIAALYVRGGKPGELQQYVNVASRILGARIIIAAPDGRFKVDSKEDTPYFTGSWHPLDRGALIAGDNAQVAVRSGELERFQSPIPGTHGHRDGGAVLLVTRVSDVRPSVSSLSRVLLVAAGTALLVWLLIGIYFAYSISRPLLRITAATREMARGKYGARVNVRGHGEIAMLAHSFNAMARQVQQSSQVLRDFLANASHDLRTPLTLIVGFSQALLDGTAREQDVQDSAEVIYGEALKMQRMVDDLLQLTRLESGLLTLKRHAVDVHSFVQNNVDQVNRAHTSESVARIENRTPARLPPMEVDPDRMERVLRNLLENALEYTPEGGLVTVDARELNVQTLQISVSDTGAGISAEDVPRIFERFYRSDRSRERAHGHSGLGLAIVREIVEAHGGEVSVESSPGAGTTFRFTVPSSSRPFTGANRVSSHPELSRETVKT